MIKYIHLVENEFTRTFVKNPYKKDRAEFSDWPSAKKILVEECKNKREIELRTNISKTLIEELRNELKSHGVKVFVK